MAEYVIPETLSSFEDSRDGTAPHFERPQPGSSFLFVLVLLARKRKFILWMTVGFAAVACLISLIVPPEYTATVLILPPQQGASLGSGLSDLGGLSSLASLASSAFGVKTATDMYVSMLKSESVEDAVIEKYGLMQEYHKKYFYDARKKLEWHTNIDGSKRDGLIRLSFEDHNPGRAAEIANGYIEVLRSLSQHLAITEAAQRRVIFEQQLNLAKDQLAKSEDALKQAELSTGFVQIDSQARALIQSAAQVRAQIAAKEVQIQAMQTYASAGNPQLQEKQQELAALRGQFNQLVGSDESSPDDLFPSKGNVPAAALEYARKLRDVKFDEAVYESLAKQLEIAKIDEAKEGGFLQIVSPALRPERRSFPKRVLITIGAAAFGLSLGIVITLLGRRVARLQASSAGAEMLAELKGAVWSKAQSTPVTRRSHGHQQGDLWPQDQHRF